MSRALERLRRPLVVLSREKRVSDVPLRHGDPAVAWSERLGPSVASPSSLAERLWPVRNKRSRTAQIIRDVAVAGVLHPIGALAQRPRFQREISGSFIVSLLPEEVRLGEVCGESVGMGLALRSTPDLQGAIELRLRAFEVAEGGESRAKPRIEPGNVWCCSTVGLGDPQPALEVLASLLEFTGDKKTSGPAGVRIGRDWMVGAHSVLEDGEAACVPLERPRAIALHDEDCSLIDDCASEDQRVRALGFSDQTLRSLKPRERLFEVLDSDSDRRLQTRKVCFSAVIGILKSVEVRTRPPNPRGRDLELADVRVRDDERRCTSRCQS